MLEGHVDEGGNVLSLLNEMDDQYHSLKVASHTLSRASPIFNVMFELRFTGSVDFLRLTSEKPV